MDFNKLGISVQMSELRHFTSAEINKLERFYRANLINSISGYKPANLFGTFSKSGVPNLALFTSIVNIGANPPLIGFIQRPVGEFSHTYKNIIRSGYYTINHVHESFVENAHFTSAKFPENVSEFKACQLTQEQLAEFNAPFVKESRIKIGMKFVQEFPIELNHTILMIGRIEHLFIQQDAILDDGNVNLTRVKNVCTSGLENYHKVSPLASFPYAQTDNLPDFSKTDKKSE